MGQVASMGQAAAAATTAAAGQATSKAAADQSLNQDTTAADCNPKYHSIKECTFNIACYGISLGLLVVIIFFIMITSITTITKMQDTNNTYYKQNYSGALTYIAEKTYIGRVILNEFKLDTLQQKGDDSRCSEDSNSTSDILNVANSSKLTAVFASKSVVDLVDKDGTEIPTEYSDLGKYIADTFWRSSDPFKVKKDIESIDYFGQYREIDTSVEYFRKFLLNANDKVYKDNNSPENISIQVYDKIASLLTDKYRVIKNGHIVIEDYKSNTASLISTNLELYKSTPNKVNLISLKDSINDNVGDTGFVAIKNDVDLQEYLTQLLNDTNVTGFQIFTTNVGYYLILRTQIRVFKEHPDSASTDDQRYSIIYSAEENSSHETYIGNLRTSLGESVFFAKPELSSVLNGYSIPLIKDTNTNQSMLLGYIYNNLKYFTDIIILEINSIDINAVFEMNQTDTTFISTKLYEQYGNNFDIHIKPAIDNLLNNLHHQLIFNRNNKITNNMITYERFSSKLLEMTSKQFISEIVYNSYVIYDATKNIGDLNMDLDDTNYRIRMNNLVDKIFDDIFILIFIAFTKSCIGSTFTSLITCLQNDYFLCRNICPSDNEDNTTTTNKKTTT